LATALTIFIVLGVAFAAARHRVRSFFYPWPRSMPRAPGKDIDAALRRFEAALAAHAPQVLAALQPGLPEEQLRDIEFHYRLKLTDELRAMYRWRNGATPEAQIELIPGHRFLPFDHAAELREAMGRQLSDATLLQRVAYWIFAGHRSGWLTVLDDLCGDGYFYDPARRRWAGSFFYHFAEDRNYRFFPSLSDFLTGAAECYETGIYSSGGKDEDFERSAELWERYSRLPEF